MEHSKNTTQPILYWQNLSIESIKYFDDNGVEQTEEWRAVSGYEGFYEVSDLGRVKSLDRFIFYNKSAINPTLKNGIILKQSETDERGYVRVQLTVDKKEYRQYVHIIVAEHFIPNPDNKRTVNHKKGNKKDNRKISIEWQTYGENHEHSYRELGRIHSQVGKTGYNNNQSKEILCVTTGMVYGSLSEASRDLNIPFQNISKVCLGKRHTAHGLSFKYINNEQ